jgi:hypothetical protein
MATTRESIDVPYREAVVDPSRLLSVVWTDFFRSLFDRVYSLGSEQSCPLVNNQASPADVVGLKVNSRAVSQATVEYLVQRVTTGGSAVELTESGIFILTFNPTGNSWNIHAVNEGSPDDAGITFSVTAAGQVRYTTTSVAGDPSLSRIVWRMRTLAGKSAQYSSQGAR